MEIAINQSNNNVIDFLINKKVIVKQSRDSSVVIIICNYDNKIKYINIH